MSSGSFFLLLLVGLAAASTETGYQLVTTSSSPFVTLWTNGEVVVDAQTLPLVKVSDKFGGLVTIDLGHVYPTFGTWIAVAFEPTMNRIGLAVYFPELYVSCGTQCGWFGVWQVSGRGTSLVVNPINGVQHNVYSRWGQATCLHFDVNNPNILFVADARHNGYAGRLVVYNYVTNTLSYTHTQGCGTYAECGSNVLSTARLMWFMQSYGVNPYGVSSSGMQLADVNTYESKPVVVLNQHYTHDDGFGSLAAAECVGLGSCDQQLLMFNRQEINVGTFSNLLLADTATGAHENLATFPHGSYATSTLYRSQAGVVFVVLILNNKPAEFHEFLPATKTFTLSHTLDIVPAGVRPIFVPAAYTENNYYAVGLDSEDRQVLFGRSSCPAGTSQSGTAFDCAACPVGTYKSLNDASACLACPVGTETKSAGATECTPIVPDCPAGQQPNQAVCSACPVGTYKALNDASACLACPVGTTTEDTGAASPSECVPVVVKCPPQVMPTGYTQHCCTLGNNEPLDTCVWWCPDHVAFAQNTCTLTSAGKAVWQTTDYCFNIMTCKTLAVRLQDNDGTLTYELKFTQDVTLDARYITVTNGYLAALPVAQQRLFEVQVHVNDTAKLTSFSVMPGVGVDKFGRRSTGEFFLEVIFDVEFAKSAVDTTDQDSGLTGGEQTAVGLTVSAAGIGALAAGVLYYKKKRDGKVKAQDVIATLEHVTTESELSTEQGV